MKVIADLCVIPLGVGISFSPYVAEIERVLSKYDVSVELHATGTSIEGEYSVIMDAVHECLEKLHQMGVPRIFSTIHISSRTDQDQTMAHKVASVREELSKDSE